MHSNLLLRKPTDSKLYVEDVFSTYLYTGNGTYSPKTGINSINNGIDLAGKGGLVWTKIRGDTTGNHVVFDTSRGVSQLLSTNLTDPQTLYSGYGVTSFNSNGFTLEGNLYGENLNGKNEVSWTFRKAPKFFDVVTWSGNDSSNRVIPHSLGTTPGFILIKNISVGHSWLAWHRSLAGNNVLALNETSAQFSSNGNVFSVNSTSFSVAVGSALTPASNYVSTNAGGTLYVAYLFAHDTTADGVIQCGSYTTDVSGNATVNLGWEPQYVLYKPSSSTGSWWIADNMRGMTSGGGVKLLAAQNANAELSAAPSYMEPTATGFKDNATFGAVSTTVIYLAIRRGPMRVPTDATKVFKPDTWAEVSNPPGIGKRTFGFPPDLFMMTRKSGGYGFVAWDRLRGLSADLSFANTTAEGSYSSYPLTSMDNTGVTPGFAFNNSPGESEATFGFSRAPGFFDVVCYTTTNSTNQRITHNLGVAPEMIITKNRGSAGGWFTYVAALGRSKYLSLNGTAASNGFGNDWGTSDPTSTDFGYNTQIFQPSPYSGNTVVAYLFATCPGVSKVGSYTGTGTTQQINCGFTNGARFVLIKRTDSTGDWTVWDTARGIVSGNDPYLLLNSTAAEVTNTDYIDPLSTGFEISSTAPAAINANGGTFVFLAIA